MTKQQRLEQIATLVGQNEELSLHELARRLGRVSVVTVRRDVAELAEQGLLLRTHGGAAALGKGVASAAVPTVGDFTGGPLGVGDVDAIIMPPVGGTGASTLRNWARRRHIPFIAETCEQEGGLYVGHDNFAVGRELGHRAGTMLNGTLKSADVLVVSFETLPNTRARADGFLRGFTEAFSGNVRHWRVDGRGVYRIAKQAALEAFSAHRSINVVFGVNDHSVLALLDAASERGVDVAAFSVGGEGAALYGALREDDRLKACAALFPELVGMQAIDTIAAILAGQRPVAPVTTPHAIVTAETLGDYYEQVDSEWSLRRSALDRFSPALAAPVPLQRFAGSPAIGFVPHYPSHDWYRNMIRAMQGRCDLYGFTLRVAPPQADIAEEIAYVRLRIAQAAASRVLPGDTIVINSGPMSLLLADELKARSGVTIVTNSIDILERLSGRPDLKVILTSGEYQAADRCMVGPSLAALFETMSIDKAFLSVDGISTHFGPSASDDRRAIAARRFAEASRELFIMADHSLFGVQASHRIVPLGTVTEVIADSGTLATDRFAMLTTGLRVILADEEPDPRQAGQRPTGRRGVTTRWRRG